MIQINKCNKVLIKILIKMINLITMIENVNITVDNIITNAIIKKMIMPNITDMRKILIKIIEMAK